MSDSSISESCSSSGKKKESVAKNLTVSNSRYCRQLIGLCDHSLICVTILFFWPFYSWPYACVRVLRLLPDWWPAECGLAGTVKPQLYIYVAIYFRESGHFLQNGRLLQHVNHLTENSETAASRLLYQDLIISNGERVVIDIHCGVLFVTGKMMIICKTAGWQSTKMSSCYNTAVPTPSLVSGTVDFVQFQ